MKINPWALTWPSSQGQWFPVSIDCWPERAKPQEEGHPREGDHLREKAPILGRQPLSPPKPRTKVGAKKPVDEVLPGTISGMRDKLPHIPAFRGGNIIEELWGEGELPEKV